jgi:hypothetical protein
MRKAAAPARTASPDPSSLDAALPVSEFTPAHVIEQEQEFINRRQKSGASRKTAFAAGFDPSQIGLAFSGGGVRSAAFCLGVAQALHHHGLWPRIGYLSTVSGGGYAGAAITATMTRTKGEFVFSKEPPKSIGSDAASSDISDSPAVGHLRNYSSYLIPAGFRDLILNIVIMLRGLVANLLLVMPWILFSACLTIWSNNNRSDLQKPDVLGFDTIYGVKFSSLIPVDHFGITLLFLLLFVLSLIHWARRKSSSAAADGTDIGDRSLSTYGALMVCVVLAFAMELQAFVLEGFFVLASTTVGGLSLEGLAGWLKTTAASLTSVLAGAVLFKQQLGQLIKTAETGSGVSAAATALAGKAVVWIAALAVPALLWVTYLYLAYWGIYDDISSLGGDHTPIWLLDGATGLAEIFSWSFPPTTRFTRVLADRPMLLLYMLVGAFLLAVGWKLTPNANSLHRLYRDRLSKAFLFDPLSAVSRPAVPGAARTGAVAPPFAPLDTFKLSDLAAGHAPFHIINAALNIQASAVSNMRGRNAEFFTFTPTHVGSTITGYAPIAAMEAAEPRLDLATAIAVSGAAASSNMGSNSIKPLAPTLALLNVRLGYWLRNPARIIGRAGRKAEADPSLFYLWKEMWGLLRETDRAVYLTDGGHIENLGVYELLRRRCRLIIAVDAEADPAHSFGSFIKLQRYARIDLGIRIEMPWQAIRDVSTASMGKAQNVDLGNATDGVSEGPHMALGTIDYGGGSTGYLLYVKSSLTGDENDYVRDYARRHAFFPQESTADQFFSEEQFEVYRALGFHCLHGAFNSRKPDDVAVSGAVGLEQLPTSDHEAVMAVRALLGMPEPKLKGKKRV